MNMKERIVKQSNHTEWELFGDISNFNAYTDFLTALKDAQEGDGIMLKINCTGGDASIGFMITQALSETKATVVCNVVYPSYSMGAVIAVAGDYLIMQPHTFLMFHTYSTGLGGKSGDILKMMSHDDASLKGMMDDVCTPFLTKAELKKMHQGDDIYITSDDPTLPARLKRHFRGIDVQRQ